MRRILKLVLAGCLTLWHPGPDAVGCALRVSHLAGVDFSAIPPQDWLAVRVRYFRSKPMTPEWIRARVYNSTFSMVQMGRHFGISRETFRDYTLGAAVPNYRRGELERILSEPDWQIPQDEFWSFGEWINYHLRNVEGATSEQVGKAAGVAPDALSNYINDLYAPGQYVYERFAGALHVPVEEAYASGLMIREPREFHNWLRTEMLARNYQPTELARALRYSKQKVYPLLKGTAYPSREDALRIAWLFKLPESEVLEQAGYLPEWCRLGRWIRGQLASRGWSKRDLYKRTSFYQFRLEHLLYGAFPTRDEVIEIGRALGNLPRAFIMADMQQLTPRFQDWTRAHYMGVVRDPDPLLGRRMGISLELVERLFDEDPYIPPRDQVLRLARYWGRSAEEALAAAGYLPVRRLSNWQHRTESAVDESHP
jgi:transcriptional regulator with XRE-family HTH domain